MDPSDDGRYDFLFDQDDLDARLTDGAHPAQAYREVLQAGDAALRERFEAGDPPDGLVRGRARLIDRVLTHSWRRLLGDRAARAALVAVGGYGRGELLPGSDIDIMVLLPEAGDDSFNRPIGSWLTFLWDIGLEVGHSVRTVAECEEQARADVTVMTNLVEARLVDGHAGLFDAMRERVGPDRAWSSREFFEAKLAEQRTRHHKFHDTAYKLEPNIKESPGGLRDIQMIGWVAKRHFGEETLGGLVAQGFLTEAEHHALVQGQSFLWRLRIALHHLTGRREDRLLFDYQRTLAQQLGYRDEGHRLAVEHFMKQYYRTVMELNRLNEMLLQLFSETIFHGDDPGEPVAINRRFQVRRGFLEVVNEEIFLRYPFALLEIFLLMQQHPDIKGVRASTIRLIRDHRHLINDDFRKDLRARSLFMEILRQPRGVTHELRRMNRYGVLAAYLPAFGNIVGQMQYDLFHVYTVDVHTLFLVRNLRRFTVPRFADEYPLCSRIIANIPKPELLYLAGLFHDIAKGRGGDHSELGAADAEAFCLSHGLSHHDTNLVSWLVRNHLLMSTTAQRKDIGDPLVINEFAQAVGSQARLDYLYLLTVADIRATNPALWNSWKDALLIELYTETSRALRRGLENPLEQGERIREVKSAARGQLIAEGMNREHIDAVWDRLIDDYFLRCTPEEIAWHTRKLAAYREEKGPLVELRRRTQRGGTELFLYARLSDNLFARSTALLDRLGLTVADARLIALPDGHAIYTFIVLEHTGRSIPSRQRAREILDTLRSELRGPVERPARVSRRAPRQFKHFPVPTRVLFSTDAPNHRTVIELITSDRPGLLSQVARVFLDAGIRLQNAKVATFGARAEDVFYVTDRDNRPLDDPQLLEQLKADLVRTLEESAPAQAATAAE